MDFPTHVASLPNTVSATVHCLSRRFLVALAGLLLLLAWPAHGAQDFLEPEQAFRLQILDEGPGGVRLHWEIAPGYYLYRDRMGAKAVPSGEPLELRLPAGESKDDPNFGLMEVYHDEATMEVAAAGAGALELTWQGCADAGLCYPPQTRTIRLAAAAAGPGTPAMPAPDGSSAPTGEAGGLLAAAAGSDGEIAGLLSSRSLGWTLPMFFLLGIALAFTPCVLPMLPLVSSLVVGRQASPQRAFGLSLAFVLPMALTYAALGVAAALAGANVQALLQNRWTALGLGALYVVLALGMFGFFTLQLPAGLRERLDGASRRQRGGAPASAAMLGVLSALLVGPCMTAPLAGALLYIAQSGQVAQGALLLFALGLGMGAPLLLAGTLGARFVPRPGPWMEGVKVLLGFVLLGTAVWMLERTVPQPVALLLWGALLLAVAATLLHLAAPHGSGSGTTRGSVMTRTLALVAGLWGGAMVLGAAGGAADPWRPLAFAVAAAPAQASEALRFEPVASLEDLEARLAQARAEGRPALVDFYADWCVSCKAIEEEVFDDARVRQALSGTLLLRADVTANDARQRALMRRHQVIGPPTVMIFDSAGRERRADRLVGEFGVEQLLQRAGRVGERS